MYITSVQTSYWFIQIQLGTRALMKSSPSVPRVRSSPAKARTLPRTPSAPRTPSSPAASRVIKGSITGTAASGGNRSTLKLERPMTKQSPSLEKGVSETECNNGEDTLTREEKQCTTENKENKVDLVDSHVDILSTTVISDLSNQDQETKVSKNDEHKSKTWKTRTSNGSLVSTSDESMNAEDTKTEEQTTVSYSYGMEEESVSRNLDSELKSANEKTDQGDDDKEKCLPKGLFICS